MDKEELLAEYLVSLLSEMIKYREANNIKPLTVELIDIINKVTSEATEKLRELCREKFLTCHKTINGVSFEFTPAK